MSRKIKYTEEFEKVLNKFVEELKKYISTETGEWTIKGFIDIYKNIYTSVIKDFDFFVAPKWKIASDSQGSGNTANIGSIKDIADLKTGNGVFSKLGKKWFDEYWMNYGNATMLKDGKTIKITNI